jgi:hypothetical protein
MTGFAFDYVGLFHTNMRYMDIPCQGFFAGEDEYAAVEERIFITLSKDAFKYSWRETK